MGKANLDSAPVAPTMAALDSFFASAMPADILKPEADMGVIDESGTVSEDSCSCSLSVIAEAVAIALAFRKPARACSWADQLPTRIQLVFLVT